MPPDNAPHEAMREAVARGVAEHGAITEVAPPRIWIGCLAAYNEGKLHGEWFDAAVDEDEIWAAKDKVIRTSPAWHPEEWFIADNEGFEPYQVGEYDGLSKVALVARMIEEHGVAFAVWLSNDDSVLDGVDEHDLEEAFREAFRGEWDSEESFAREQVGEIGLPTVGYLSVQSSGSYSAGSFYERSGGGTWSDLLDQIDIYLDWDTITRTMMEDFWSDERDGTVYVFDANA